MLSCKRDEDPAAALEKGGVLQDMLNESLAPPAAVPHLHLLLVSPLAPLLPLKALSLSVCHSRLLKVSVVCCSLQRQDPRHARSAQKKQCKMADSLE